MKKLLFIFIIFVSINAQSISQPPLIVEFDVFKEAEKICNGSDYTKLKCLVNTLKPYNNRIYTKISGTRGNVSVIFYALQPNGEITYPEQIESKICKYVDTFGRKSISKLSGNGFSYVIGYIFRASSSFSKAYISCNFTQNGVTVSQTSQPISIIPNDFDIHLMIKTAQDSTYNLNAQDNITPDSPNLVLKAQTHTININANATARTIHGEIDNGFSDDIIPIQIRFNRDNGLCSPVGESANGTFKFKNGRYTQNNIHINFIDVASGELEIVLGHTLDRDDRIAGKCLLSPVNHIDITNAGKIPCQKPIIIKKRVDIVPFSFFANLDNDGRQIYYNQHTYIPAIQYLPTTNIDIKALNDKNQMLKNFTKDCYAKDISIKLDDNKNNFLFINENIPDSIIPKDTFLENSQSRVIRKLSSSGIKDRDLTPLDTFISSVVNLNDTFLRIEFFNSDEKYPIYFIHPKIKNDWRIALMRGRISFITNTNTNATLVANPNIYYEIYCKSPVCKIVDIESVLSPKARFPASSTKDWYINTAHPRDLMVQENHILLPEHISIYSIGNIVNGIQTLALQSSAKGSYDVKIKQGNNPDDFAMFLYFSPSFINIRQDLGVKTTINF